MHERDVHRQIIFKPFIASRALMSFLDTFEPTFHELNRIKAQGITKGDNALWIPLHNRNGILIENEQVDAASSGEEALNTVEKLPMAVVEQAQSNILAVATPQEFFASFGMT